MTRRITYQSVTAPTLFITRNKQRVKQYGRTVYLYDGQEFELELFNPTQKKVLAKIKLNGKYLEAGIVLRPGERVFLERYINEARKFIFNTYNVDANDPNVQKAIQNNGKVDVEFYDEYTPSPYIWWNTPNYTPNWDDGGGVFYYSTSDDSMNTIGSTLTSSNSENVSWSVDNNTRSARGITPISQKLKRTTKETGRVEKGGRSNQELTYDGTQFNSWYTWSDSWTILPASEKVAYTREEIVVYCTSCGTKRKKTSYKFCPNCGTKY